MLAGFGRTIGVASATMIGLGSAFGAIVPVSTQGVIVQQSNGGCNTFEADNGLTYLLDTQGPFVAGDRVQVDGSYDDTTVGWCGNTGGPRIINMTIRPAFAGVGTLVSTTFGIRLQTDDGRMFALQNGGGSRAGTSVYVQGTVDTSARVLTIINNVIGPSFSGFGRITDINPAHIRFTAESGQVYSMDRFGSVPVYTTIVGDYIFVEGIRAKAINGVIPLTSVTARPAFNASGRVVATSSGVAFDADTLIFAPQYTASALTGQAVGAKVYLRGRNADDYDFGEPRTANNIRLSRVGQSYTAVGYLDRATKTVINLDDGTLVNLEWPGDPLFHPTGSIVYVAGPIASQGPGTVTLSHNQTRVGVIATGWITSGVTCSPIVLTQQNARIFPKNNGGFPFLTHVRIVGGLTFDSPCFDESSVVDNTIAIEPIDR